MNQTPFPAEPMSPGKILDRTFKTYFGKFAAFAIFAFLIQGLFSLIVFILEQVFLSQSVLDVADLFAGMSQQLAQTGDFDAILPQLEDLQTELSGNSWVSILTFAANFFIAPIVLGGFAAVASGYFLGEERTPREWLSYTLSKYKALFTTYVCSFLMILGIAVILAIFSVFVFILFGLLAAAVPFLGVLLIIAAVAALVILALFIGAAYLMVFPIAIREDLSGFAPLIRALRLGSRKFWRTIGTLMLTGLIVGIAEGLVTGVVRSAVNDAFPVSLVATGVLSLVMSLLTGPIVPIAMVLHYFSVRIEKEGYLAPPPSEYQASWQQWPAQQNAYVESEIPPYPPQNGMPTDPSAEDTIAETGAQPPNPDQSVPEQSAPEQTAPQEDPDKKNGGPQGPQLL